MSGAIVSGAHPVSLTTLAVDPPTLVVDATNHRVGVGIAAPLAKLSVYDAALSSNFNGLHVGGNITPHGFSALVPTSAYLTSGPASTTEGGGFFSGFSSGATRPGMYVVGHVGSAAPTAAGIGVILQGWKSDGATSRVAMATTETVLSVQTGTTPLLTLSANGSLGLGTTSPGALLDLGLAGTTLGVVRLAGSTSGNITVQPPAVAGSGTLTLPVATDTLVGKATTDVLTNKALTPRVVSMADAASFTPTGDTADINSQTNTQALGTLTANAPSGTPVDGQSLIIRIKSTNVQTFAWNAIYRGSTDVVLPTVSSGASKWDYIAFRYHSTDSKWDCLAKALGY